MTDLQPLLRGAADEFLRVARGIGPAQLSAPTPCTEYDVRALLNHLLYWGPWLEAAVRKEETPSMEGGERAADLVHDDWQAALTTRVHGLLEAFASPGAFDGTAGGMPAEMVASMILMEWVVHGWDLASATGQTLHCDDETAGVLLVAAKAMAEQGRAHGIFKDEVPVARDAPALARVLAVTGRPPEWCVANVT
ncbi:TIGR03086 family protein [Amycolatopsis acidicola]|uniref:TIGR03086 family protein n=1 Tax=Amycolatopsis acidicola TaxID=2596893 RepID=A0A5N0UT67_9PSEU|nr:TIGR03086 family metal-binding protein [Amycolatopsis acidicola]KAA9152419.1 TIGR03086 family protein [Amycolatopsis acidicola]